MKTHPTYVSWTCEHPPTHTCGFVIYAARSPGERGEKVGETCRDDRSAVVGLREGWWYVRVAIKLTNCREQQWPRLISKAYHVTGREYEPQGPASLEVAQVEPDVHALVAFDPPSVAGGEHYLQVVEVDAADPWPGSGLLVGEIEPKPAGVLEDRGRVAHSVPLDGFAQAPSGTVGPLEERTLVVSAIGPGGRRGTDKVATAKARERIHHGEQLIARVDTVGATYSGFPAPTTGDLHEHDPALGFVSRLLPTISDAAGWAALGTVGGPSVASALMPAPYPQSVAITTDEADLGADVVFVMECHAAIRRCAHAATSLPVHGLRFHPAFPAHDVPGDGATEQHQDGPTTYGPTYLARDTIAGTGKARDPLKLCRWEVRVSPSSPIGTAWHDYVPGMQLRGRYVQARLTLFDETGWHQLKTGELRVSVRFPRRRWETSVAWPGALPYPGVAVALPVHPITGGSLFPNAMVAVATPQGIGGVTSCVAVSGQAPGAALLNVMVWDAAGAARVLADTVDLIVTGY